MPFGGLVGMNPGGGMSVPGNIGGGSAPGKKPSNWWALAAAPIAALLGQAIGGVDFAEGLGAFGQGFAGEKYNQLKQRRQREFEEEGRTIDLAHKAVQDLSGIDSATIQKFPQLQELAQKYQAALADDGKISAKEAKDIVVLNQHLQAELASAKTDQETTQRQTQQRQDFDFKESLQAEQMGRAFPGTEGAPPEMLQDVGRTALDQQRFAELPQLQTVNLGGQERQIPMTPREQFMLAKEEERSRRAEQAEARRLAAQESIERHKNAAAARAERSLGMRESAADFRDQVTEWRENKAAALAELKAAAFADTGEEKIDPEELKRFNAEWEAIRPRKAGRERIAPPAIAPAPMPEWLKPEFLTGGQPPPKSSGRFKILGVE